MHLLNTGKSDTGKTTFTADFVLPAAAKTGAFAKVIVFDKNFANSPRWKTGHNLPVQACSDLSEFSEAVFSDVNCIVIADEIGLLSVKEQEDVLTPIAVTCRHLGHVFIAMAQRASMVRPSVRGQTSAYIAFAQSPDDIKALRGIHNDDMLSECENLNTGEFVTRIGNNDIARRGRLF